MAIIFPKLNPLKFDALSFFDFKNPETCYFQKWFRKDTLKIQVLTDFSDLVSFKILDFYSRKVVFTGQFSKFETDLNSENRFFQTLNLPFKSFQFGRYIMLINGKIWSKPFEVIPEDSGTVLLNYRNTINSLNCSFENGWFFEKRFSGKVHLYSPEIDSTIYRDQKLESVLLYAMPSGSYSLTVGTGLGVAEWELEILNFILCCDLKLVDSAPFELKEGTVIEVERLDNYSLVSGTVEIVDKENLKADVFETIKIWGLTKLIAVTQDGSNIIRV